MLKTTETAKEIFIKYYEFTKQPTGFKEGFMILEDRYNDSIPM